MEGHLAVKATNVEGRADDGLIHIADTRAHLTLHHNCVGKVCDSIAYVHLIEFPERSVASGSTPAHDHLAVVLGVQLCRVVLDDEEVVCLIYIIYIVGFAHYAKCGAITSATTCSAEVLTIVVLDGKLTILFPEAPDVVAAECLVAEAHLLSVAIVVHHLACTVALCRSAGDVVPVFIAFGADLRTLYHVELHLHHEVGEHHSLAVRTFEVEVK